MVNQIKFKKIFFLKSYVLSFFVIFFFTKTLLYSESCNSYGYYDSVYPSDEPLKLTLENALNIALSTQRRLGSAFNNVTQSEINLELAEADFDIRYIPKADAGYVGGGRAGAGSTLGGGIEIFKKFQQGTRFSIFPSVMKAAHNFQSNLKTVFTQPLLRGFGREYTLSPLRAAQFSNRSAQRSLFLAQTRLILQTIQGLYEVIRQEAFTHLDEESLKRVQKFCTSTKMKEKIALCDSLDVYRAEIELKRAEDTLSQSLDRLQDAKDNLRDVLALPPNLEIIVDVPIEYQTVEIGVNQAIEMALYNRIEIVQADDQIEEFRRQQYMAKSNLMPEINLMLDYSSLSRDEEFTKLWTYKRESKWGIGFTTSTDIARNRENAAYQQSILTTADAVRNAEQVRDNVTLDVKRNLRALIRSQEKIVLQEKQINNSLKEFHLARVKFEHGLVNNFDLIQAEKNLQAAQTGLVAALVDHKIGQYKLLATLGILTDKPCNW